VKEIYTVINMVKKAMPNAEHKFIMATALPIGGAVELAVRTL
jgi:hypothetical protein